MAPMDADSRTVTTFLESLQDAMKRMRDEVWAHYQRLGARPGRPFLVLSGRPFSIYEKVSVRKFRGCIALGLLARGADDKEYDIAVEVLWDQQRWTIVTEIWRESEEGQDLLRALP